MLSESCFSPAACEVHGCLNFDQTDTFPVYRTASDQGLGGYVPSEPPGCCESFHHLITDIMWRSGISGFGVAKTDDHLFIALDGGSDPMVAPEPLCPDTGALAINTGKPEGLLRSGHSLQNEYRLQSSRQQATSPLRARMMRSRWSCLLAPLSKTRSPSREIELMYSEASRTWLKARKVSSAPGLRALRTLEAQGPTKIVMSAISWARIAVFANFEPLSARRYPVVRR